MKRDPENKRESKGKGKGPRSSSPRRNSLGKGNLKGTNLSGKKIPEAYREGWRRTKKGKQFCGSRQNIGFNPHDATLGIRAQPWVAARHPQYTGALGGKAVDGPTATAGTRRDKNTKFFEARHGGHSEGS